MSDRCPNCDRPNCPLLAIRYPSDCPHRKDPTANPCYACLTVYEDSRWPAMADCEAHRVNWRERALAAEARQVWVPVTERLPVDYADVLVSQFDAVARAAHVMSAYCVTYDYQRQCVWWAKGRTIVTPTHWRPLPAPPVVSKTERSEDA